MKRIMIAAAAMLMSGTALASDLGSYKDGPAESAPCVGSRTWTGFTLSAGIRADIMNAGSYTYENSSTVSVAFRDVSLEGHLTAEYQFANSPLVLGGFGSIGYNGVAGVVDESLGVTLGAAFGNVKPYALVSAEFMDSSFSDYVKGTGDLRITNSGIGYGGGVRFRLTSHVVADLEYKRISWGSVDEVDIKEDRVTARLGYQF
jgi:opacity protein-like surface antigen